MLSLRKYLRDILEGIKILNAKSNKYYKESAQVSNKVNNSLTVCTLLLPKGTYLVFGNVSANVDAGVSSLLASAINSASGVNILMGAQGRSTMNAGGGCQSWALAEVTSEKGSVRLTTYGYYSGSWTYAGKLLAIRLI